MSDFEDLLANRQHPMVVSAINLMDEAERPTVPVRTYDDSERLFEEVLKRFGPVKLSPKAIGVVPIDKSAIYINSKSKEFQDPWTLASKLRHEQFHVTQPKVESWRETPAYEQELAFVNKNATRFNQDYRNQLVRTLEEMRKKETALQAPKSPVR